MLGLDFKLNPPDSPEARNQCLQTFLWAMIVWNGRLLKMARQYGKPLPKLYESGVRYIREPEGQEHWEDIHSIINNLGADCEDLAAWRVAELRDMGIAARPAWRHRRVESEDSQKQYSLYHILVAIPVPEGHGKFVKSLNGWFEIEDPSAKLGMNGDG
jgi:hypothetical protein